MQAAEKSNEEKIDKRILREHYRNYDLLSRYWKNEYRGRIMKHQKVVFDVVGSSVDEVIVALRQHVDDIIKEKRSERKGVEPSLEELEEALQSVRSMLSNEQVHMLKTHASRPNRSITILDLQTAGRYRSSTKAMLDYADISRRICDELAYTPSLSEANRGLGMMTASMAILIEMDGSKADGSEHWWMRTDVAKMIMQW